MPENTSIGSGPRVAAPRDPLDARPGWGPLDPQPGPFAWGLITGEYPPAPGGVSDYTAQLAAALAAAGDAVHVWAPGPLDESAGIVTHPLPDLFHRKGRRQLAADLEKAPAQMRLLLQYVPHAFGYKAMNVRLTRWLARPRPQPLWIMFHEVAVKAEPGARRPLQVLAGVTQHMARQLRRAAAEAFVSTPAWDAFLQELLPGSPPAHWMPVPSNLPLTAPAEEVAAVRARLAPGGKLVASFGRFQEFARACLRPLLRELLERDPELNALLIGEGGEKLREEILAAAPALAARLHAPGLLPTAAASAHIAAADLLVQPYPDGISGRRGTAMAGLALGRCLLSHAGEATEPVWRQAGAVALAAPVALRPVAEELLGDTARRQTLATRGQELYYRQFALEHTVRILRATTAAAAPVPAAAGDPAR
ncbi:MAG: glycosyltransferase [Terriglobales bacterium]